MSQKRELLGNDRRMEVKCPSGRAGLAKNRDICLLLLFYEKMRNLTHDRNVHFKPRISVFAYQNWQR